LTDRNGGKWNLSAVPIQNAERHSLSEADAKRSPDLSHVKAEACGRPSYEARTINVAEASTCTAPLIATQGSSS
jgi:hypothetical protein